MREMTMTDEHKRYAIVIGVSMYDDDIAELPYAKNDAYRVQSVVREHAGFSDDRVYFLANGFESNDKTHAIAPTRSNILQKVKYVCDAAGTEDLIVLYFAGHGVEISKTPYLITADTRMDVLSQTALNVDELNTMLEEAGCQCVLRVFDACRSPFAQGRGTLDRMTDGFQKAVMKCAKGWASLSACSSGEVAHESAEFNQGVFSYYLCEGWSGKATNQYGNVTIEGLVDYVKASVSNWCDRQTLLQTPHFQSDLSGSLVLATPAHPTEGGEATLCNLFGELVVGIEKQLSSTAEDTRRLTFTSEEEWKRISTDFHLQLASAIEELSHPAISVAVGENQPLQYRGDPPWREFNDDLAASSLQKEFTSNTASFQVDFSSREVVLPTTSLYVAVVRFNFLYWLWYCHICQPHQLQGKFKPNPAYTKGFFTFKPSAARDNEKREGALREMLVRSSREILTWAQQLGDYVEARVEPLRKIGPIVE